MTNAPIHTDESLPKAFKLCSVKKIEQLFAHGLPIKAYPLRLVYLIEECAATAPTAAPFQVLLAAPKRRFKMAHDRNYIKRLMREVLRKNKTSLIEQLVRSNKKLVFSLTYIANELPNYQLLEQKLCKALDQLIQELKL